MFHSSFNESDFILLLILLSFDITLQRLKFVFNVHYISTTGCFSYAIDSPYLAKFNAA